MITTLFLISVLSLLCCNQDHNVPRIIVKTDDALMSSSCIAVGSAFQKIYRNLLPYHSQGPSLPV